VYADRFLAMPTEFMYRFPLKLHIPAGMEMIGEYDVEFADDLFLRPANLHHPLKKK
jgi:hypothetical protein